MFKSVASRVPLNLCAYIFLCEMFQRGRNFFPSFAPLFFKGFGYSDVENRTLVTPNTVMRVASISKAITAAAVGRLVEEGKLDLDRPVSDLVESW